MDERYDLPSEDSSSEGSTELAPFFGTAKEMLERYSHCALCGANLHFTHITDFSQNITHETARCPECGIKARQLLHRLQ